MQTAARPNRIVITEALDPQCRAWLAERFDCRDCAHDEPGFPETLAEADALIVRTYTRVDRALLAQAPKLRVVGRAGVGLDNIDLEACRERGVIVVHTPEANSQAVAEYVLGLMLDDLRPRTNLPADVDAATFHALRASEVGRQLDQLTLGILGCGRVGRRLGRIAHAIGMPIRVCDLLPESRIRDAAPFPFEFVDRNQLLSGSDVISVHVDGRSENRHLIDRTALERLGEDVLFINSSRGFVVDEAALADWAAEHPRARLVLDVHDPEPPVPGDALSKLANVRRLPHLASRTTTAMEAMSWVVRDVATVLEGREPRYPA